MSWAGLQRCKWTEKLIGLTFVCYRVLLCWLVLVQLVGFRRRFLAFGDLFLSCCHRLSIRGLFLLACSLFALFPHTPCLCQEDDTMPAIIVATQWSLGVIWWWFSTGFASRTRFYIEWAEAYGKKYENIFVVPDYWLLHFSAFTSRKPMETPQRKYKYLQMTVYTKHNAENNLVWSIYVKNVHKNIQIGLGHI